MIAFIAFTPYHIWNSIVMAQKTFSDEKCDSRWKPGKNYKEKVIKGICQDLV